jgi:YbbR domain-containing protein
LGFLRRLVTQNLSLKLASVALAVLLWTVVRVETPERQTLPGVPVRVSLTDPGWALADEPLPSTVEVVFNGPARELFRMAVDRPTLTIPVDEVQAGDTVVFLRREWLAFQGQGIVAEDFQPSSVRLSFDPIKTGTVPLKVRWSGELPAGLALAAPMASDPRTVRVSGPQRRVEGLDSVNLEALDLAQVNRSGAYEVGVDTTGIGNVELSLRRVSVIVQVEDQVRREIPGVPVVASGPVGGRVLQVVPAGMPVLLLGARSVVDAVEPAGLRVVFPGSAVQSLAAGDSVRLRVFVEGHPTLVRAQPAQDSVLVRWVPPPGTSGGGP